MVALPVYFFGRAAEVAVRSAACAACSERGGKVSQNRHGTRSLSARAMAKFAAVAMRSDEAEGAAQREAPSESDSEGSPTDRSHYACWCKNA
jgi:hypothetical protein